MLLFGLFTLILIVTITLVYMFWLRPILMQRPTFKEFYAQEDTFWKALVRWSSGIRQKLTTITVVGGGSIVSIYDFCAPLISQAGVDVTKITDRVPSWVWPVLTMALLGLVQFFRNLNDKQVAVEKNVEKIMEVKDGPTS